MFPAHSERLQTILRVMDKEYLDNHKDGAGTYPSDQGCASEEVLEVYRVENSRDHYRQHRRWLWITSTFSCVLGLVSGTHDKHAGAQQTSGGSQESSVTQRPASNIS